MLQRKMLAGIWIVVYVGLLLIAEYATIYDLRIGMIFHGCLLLVLMLHGTIITENTSVSNMYIAFSIAPLVRILSLCVPLTHFEIMLWFIIISVPLFIAIFTCIHIQHIDGKNIGLNMPDPRMFRIEGAIIVAAIPLGWLEYQLLEPAMVATPGTSWVVPIVVFIVCTGFLEELLFRGLLQHTFTKALGVHGILIVSVIFGIFHLGNSWYDCLFAGLIGLTYALVVRETGSIYGVSISHGIINVMVFLVMPYLALSG
jgi:membrane protease YdiL (CAAX protease family)